MSDGLAEALFVNWRYVGGNKKKHFVEVSAARRSINIYLMFLERPMFTGSVVLIFVGILLLYSGSVRLKVASSYSRTMTIFGVHRCTQEARMCLYSVRVVHVSWLRSFTFRRVTLTWVRNLYSGSMTS